MRNDLVYAISGNKLSEQAEVSTHNPAASNLQMRILIELQVISMLLHQNSNFSEDLSQLRADVAASIT